MRHFHLRGHWCHDSEKGRREDAGHTLKQRARQPQKPCHHPTERVNCYQNSMIVLKVKNSSRNNAGIARQPYRDDVALQLKRMKNTLLPTKEKISEPSHDSFFQGGEGGVAREINLTDGSSFKSSESNIEKADWTSAAFFEESFAWHSDNNADLSIPKADTALLRTLQRAIRGFTLESKCLLSQPRRQKLFSKSTAQEAHAASLTFRVDVNVNVTAVTIGARK